jgi:hypothetical protein
MILLFTVAVSLCTLISLALIRKLNDKWLEVFHFSTMYLLAFVVFNIAWYIFYKHTGDPQYWRWDVYITQTIWASVLFVLPTFTLACLLYPFRIIKRSRVLIVILAVITILVVGVITIGEIAHALSDM